MNPSYGDSTNSAYGRAQVPGPAGGHDGPDDDPYDYDVRYDSPRSPVPAPGRASVRSSGTSGRAAVSGSASVGSASVGSASVRPGSGYDDDLDWGGGGNTGSTGRARVGGGTAGRATVGRASVGGSVDDFSGPGGGGPDGPTRLAAGGKGKKGPASKKARRRNIILASVAVFIMLTGLAVVGGAYYFDSVPLPQDLSLPESTTVYYADGPVMAKLGAENRTVLTDNQIPDVLKHAVVAAEDNTFYTNSGVDFKGIARAAWNNFTGGDRQGASTITQQYARNIADLTGISYARKLREAVIAMKLDQKYSKDQIISFYLNTVYMGRGAYGAEAAAQAYFGKSAAQLTPAEAMVLASVIKQPEPDQNDPKGSPGYDPGVSLTNATDRWNNYVKVNMVKLKFMKQTDADALQYPTNIKPKTGDAGEFGLDSPTGLVLHHVMDELTHTTGLSLKNIKTGGYKITTTIDSKMEAQAIALASPNAAYKNTSVLIAQTADAKGNTALQAGLVAIKPGTGEVLAYYGGDRGDGNDYAGISNDPILSDGLNSGLTHQPGSTFKVYTLAAAEKAGISIDSYWNGPPSKDFKNSQRVGKKTATNAGAVTNADGAGDSCPQKDGYNCPLWSALQKSMNTVFFGVGEQVTSTKVIDMAKALGIRWLKPGLDKNGKALAAVDLSKVTAAQAVSDGNFGTEVAIGQFGTTVLDQASALATLAARGVQAPTHFVKTVVKGTQTYYAPAITQTKLYDTFGLTQNMIDDMDWAMQKVVASGGTAGKDALAGGRPAAAKTGTWEYGDTANNSQAWMNGYTASPTGSTATQLAVSVWVGNQGNDAPIKWHSPGSTALQNMNGADTSGAIWKKFMDNVLKGQPNAKFAEPKHVGDPNAGNAGASPQPTQTVTQDQGNNGGNNGGGNGGGNNGGNASPTPTCLIPALCDTASPTPTKSKRN